MSRQKTDYEKYLNYTLDQIRLLKLDIHNNNDKIGIDEKILLKSIIRRLEILTDTKQILLDELESLRKKIKKEDTL